VQHECGTKAHSARCKPALILQSQRADSARRGAGRSPGR
jgi:hypothetical protein